MTDPELPHPNPQKSPTAFGARSRGQQILAVALLALVTLVVARAWAESRIEQPPAPLPTLPVEPIARSDARIEVVFVLDTTGSMSGLIEGAKAKIWSIANGLAANGQKSSVRMGLIGYRDRGDEYVTRRYDLTADIDSIYARLRSFRAGGGGDGPESVNQALDEAISQMSWSSRDDVYRVVFLVGDAPPHTDYGDVSVDASVRRARQQGISVNTVQCGAWDETRRVWQQIAKLGGGQYAAIAQDGGMVAIATPMDDELSTLNEQLARTVIGYGDAAAKSEMDSKVSAAREAPAAIAADRLSYMRKAGGRVVSGLLDLVEATAEGLRLEDVAEEELPAEMQAMAPEARSAYVEKNRSERARIQERIGKLSAKRDDYVTVEQKKLEAEGRADGFDSEVFATIKHQAAEKGITYE